MKNYKNILDENHPWWFELSFAADEMAIIVRIAEKVAENLEVQKEENTPIVKKLKESRGLQNWSGDIQDNFGFENALTSRFSDKGLELVGRLPEGVHKKRQRGTALASSLHALFIFLSITDTDSSEILPQLLRVNIAIGNNKMGSFALGGFFSSAARKALSELASNDFKDITEAMTTAYTHMWGSPLEPYQNRFAAHLGYDWGGFIAICPGNACDIGPNHTSDPEGYGYQFGSHNVDSRLQQLTLLVSLCALHDKIRQFQRKNCEPTEG